MKFIFQRGRFFPPNQIHVLHIAEFVLKENGHVKTCLATLLGGELPTKYGL